MQIVILYVCPPMGLETEKKSLPAVVAMSAAAAWLRLKNLGGHSLWYDEVLNVWDAHQPFSEIHKTLHASPPLFHYIIRIFYLAFGKDAFWLRLPSAAFGILAIPVFYFVVKKMSGPKAALWGTLLLVFCPFHVVYSHELRMYSLVFLLSLLSMFVWNESLTTDDTRSWFWFGLVSAAGLYTHNWFLFLVASQAMVSLGSRPTRRTILTFGAVALLYAPWIPFLIGQTTKDQFSFLNSSFGHQAAVTLEAFTGTKIPSGHGWAAVPATLKIIPWILVPCWFVLALINRRSPLPRLLAGCFLLPLLMAIAVSLLYKPIFHGARYTILVLPAFLFGLSLAFERDDVWGRASRMSAILCLAVWMTALGPFLMNFEKAPWKKLAAWMDQNAAPKTAVTLAGLPDTDRLILWYYAPAHAPVSNDFQFPKETNSVFMPVRAYEQSEKAALVPSDWSVGAIQELGQVSVLELNKKR